MSVLKLQPSLQSISPSRHISCSYLGGTKTVCTDNFTSHPHNSRHNGTFQTSSSRRFLTDEADKPPKQANSVEALSASSTPALEKKQKTSINFSSIGDMIPLKIAELNKYLTLTSKKIMNSRFINIGNKNNSTYNDKVQYSQSAYSLEKTVTQINQSIISFYDTSCARKTPSSQRLLSPKLSSYSKGAAEFQEDEQTAGDTPRAIGPLFPISQTTEAEKKKAEARRAEKISRLSLESRTRALVQSLKAAHSLMSKLSRTEELCDHLIAHPECVWEASRVSVHLGLYTACK